eukprot:768449-Hanusia_phi.AAC.2
MIRSRAPQLPVLQEGEGVASAFEHARGRGEDDHGAVAAPAPQVGQDPGRRVHVHPGQHVVEQDDLC